VIRISLLLIPEARAFFCTGFFNEIGRLFKSSPNVNFLYYLCNGNSLYYKNVKALTVDQLKIKKPFPDSANGKQN